MARRYARDNRGRFASKGTGATARGGRLKTAGGSKRQTQTMQASAAPRAGAIRGKVKRDPTAASRVGQQAAAPAAAKPARLRFTKQAGGRTTAELSSGNRVNIGQQGPKSFRATVVGKSGAPRMERVGFRNISEAKEWAANPNARGPRLMGGGLRTEASPRTTWRRAARPANTVSKPAGLKPQSPRKLQTAVAASRMRAINERMSNRPDIAEQHIPGRFRGQAGKRMDASIDRAVKEVQASERARLMKPKAQVRAERAAAAEAKRQAAAAKPKRTRTPESLRMSRAKQIEKRRGMNISNPAAWRPESAGRMAANAARTQERAMAFYKGAASAKPPKGSQAATKIEQAKGRTAVLTQSKNALNQQLKSLNAQIKAAGPSAGGLRLQKLQIQDRLAQVRRDITASKAAARG